MSDTELLRELTDLTNRAGEICRRLAKARPQIAEPGASLSFGAYARAILKGRARLRQVFDPGLFGEPVFEMLLELFASEEEGKVATVGDACIASAVPASTAVRWIKLMEDHGLVTRETDPTDRRRYLLRLCPRTREKLQSWLSGVCSIPLNHDLHGGHMS